MINIKHHSQFSFKSNETILANSNSLAISIITKPEEQYTLSTNWKNSLQIICPDDSTTNKDAIAKDIYNFIQTNFDETVKEIHIHCYMGVSRSAAVSLFLHEYLNEQTVRDLKKGNYTLYNRHLYSSLLNTFHPLTSYE